MRLITKRAALFFSSLALLFILSAGVDRLAGLFMSSHEPGLIFPRNVTRNFRTSEFAFAATTNSLGFRDREFASPKSAGTRVIAVGDSFTYGWGVATEQTWPRQLEQQLRSGGIDVEIANLGKPGSSPRDYADITEKAIPLLHPDIVIVGVLQGDDLAQMDVSPGPIALLTQGSDKAGAPSWRKRWRRVAGWLYPNFLTVADNRAAESPEVLTLEWWHTAQTLMTSFTAEEKARFDQLEAPVKNAFFAGDLNPSLIYLSIHSPDYFLQPIDLESEKTKLWITRLSEQLVRIRKAADQGHARVLVVAVPYGIYVSPASFASRRRLGFAVAPAMLTTNAPDAAIRTASEKAGVDFYEVTQPFRRASIDREFFFELDGHFNPAGHAFFAGTLAPLVKTVVKGS